MSPEAPRELSSQELIAIATARLQPLRDRIAREVGTDTLRSVTRGSTSVVPLAARVLGEYYADEQPI